MLQCLAVSVLPLQACCAAKRTAACSMEARRERIDAGGSPVMSCKVNQANMRHTAHHRADKHAAVQAAIWPAVSARLMTQGSRCKHTLADTRCCVLLSKHSLATGWEWLQGLQAQERTSSLALSVIELLCIIFTTNMAPSCAQAVVGDELCWAQTAGPCWAHCSAAEALQSVALQALLCAAQWGQAWAPQRS